MMSYMHVRVHEHTDGCDGTRDHSAQDRLTPSCTAFIVEAASPRAEFNQGGITAVKTDKRDKRDKPTRDGTKAHVSLPAVGGKDRADV